jgi:hypothetical protein
MATKKKVIPVVALSAGAAALAKYRADLAAAKKKGPKALAAFKAERQKAKPTKNGGATPMMAIKQFCIQCVGAAEGAMADIRGCTAPKCALYHLRPYK